MKSMTHRAPKSGENIIFISWMMLRVDNALIKLPFSILQLLPSTTQSSAYCSLKINHKMNSVDTKSTENLIISYSSGDI